MNHRSPWITAAASAAMLCLGCPGDTEIANGGSSEDGGSHPHDAGAQAGRGGSSGSGSSGSGGSGSGGSGSGGSGSGGSAGSAAGASGGSAGSGGSMCPSQIPALCRVCADMSCGEPVCRAGRWEFACPEDTDAGTNADAGSACREDTDCPGVGACPACPNSDACAEPTCVAGQCRLTCPQQGLRWYTTCGDPVCGISDDPYDDPNISNCTGEEHGDPCSDDGAQCDGVASCGAVLMCTDSDPTMGPGGCPISRARYKQDIAYVTREELGLYHEQLVQMPLASWRYRAAPTAGPQLGFIIDDIEPSAAVSGDHVNMYGYLSMAVAAIQVQQDQIRALQAETRALRDQLAAQAAPACGP